MFTFDFVLIAGTTTARFTYQPQSHTAQKEMEESRKNFKVFGNLRWSYWQEFEAYGRLCYLAFKRKSRPFASLQRSCADAAAPAAASTAVAAAPATREEAPGAVMLNILHMPFSNNCLVEKGNISNVLRHLSVSIPAHDMHVKQDILAATAHRFLVPCISYVKLKEKNRSY